MKRRAVFIDRDGVINRTVVRKGKPYPPANLSEVEILPGVLDALTKLHDAGFMLIVVTNQPDVARGITPRAVVEEINAHLAECLPIDEFRTCYHDNGDGCDCRKPLPGALMAAARQHGIDLVNSYMIGDRWRDTEAGRHAGCKTVFIDYDYDEQKTAMVDYRVTSLFEAAQIILKGEPNENN
jgi:D-glycero-D-manno-heptose 1,7-bisphosphate phosphatase